MIDRALQRQLLEKMKCKYPGKLNTTIGELEYETTYRSVSFNLTYLQEHGLIEDASTAVDTASMIYGGDDKENAYPVRGKITCKGIDFLENDGGLTAILGVVTVKLHSETLAELATAIQMSDLPTKEKSNLLERIRGLSQEGANTLIQEMVKAGLSKGPSAWEAALRFLNNAAFGV